MGGPRASFVVGGLLAMLAAALLVAGPEGVAGKNSHGTGRTPRGQLGKVQAVGTLSIALDDARRSQQLLGLVIEFEREGKSLANDAHVILSVGARGEHGQASQAAHGCTGRRVHMLDIPARFSKNLRIPRMEDEWGNSGFSDEESFEDGFEVRALEALAPSLVGVKELPHVSEHDSFSALLSVGSNQTQPYAWPRLAHSWFRTSQFGLETMFPARMLTYECRVERWEDADAIYVPYLLGLGLKMRRAKMNANASDWDWLTSELAAWLREQPSWKRREGADHFVVTGRVGQVFLKTFSGLFDIAGMSNLLGISIERPVALPMTASMPYATWFHPPSSKELKEWQDFVGSQKRRFLVSLVGSHRSELRNVLMWQCNQSTYCWLEDCGAPNSRSPCRDQWVLLSMYLNSVFCIQAKGDTCTRRGLFDSMLVGCIPVVFEDCALETQYHWNLPQDHSYYVQIPGRSLKAPPGAFMYRKERPGQDVMVEDVLKRIPEADIRRMQQRVVELIPAITYGGAAQADGHILKPDFQDAFDLGVAGLTRHIRERRRW